MRVKHKPCLATLVLCALQLSRADAVMFAPQIGGVGVAELNRLELEMMRLMDYRLRVPARTLDERVRFLLMRAEAKAGCQLAVGAAAQRSAEDAGEAMVESPQSSAAGAALARVPSQESVIGGSPRCALVEAAYQMRCAAVGGTMQGSGLTAGSGPAGAAAAPPSQVPRPPLSFAAAVARSRPLGGSPPGRFSAGVWQPQPQQQQEQQRVTGPSAAAEAPMPGARQPSWPPMTGGLAPAPTSMATLRAPGVPLHGAHAGGGTPSFAAVVAAPKRGRVSAEGRGARWQAAAPRFGTGDRPPRPTPSAVAAAAVHMGGGRVQGLPEGIKAC